MPNGFVLKGAVSRLGSDSVSVIIRDLDANCKYDYAIREILNAQWKLPRDSRSQMPAPKPDSLVVVYMKDNRLLCGQVIAKNAQTTILYDAEKYTVSLCNNNEIAQITRTPNTEDGVRLINRKEAKLKKIAAYNNAHPQQKWEPRDEVETTLDSINGDNRVIKRGDTMVVVHTSTSESEPVKKNGSGCITSPRYRGFIDATFLRGNDGVYGKFNMIGGGFTMTHGYQVNDNVFFGAGLGYYYTKDSYEDVYDAFPIYMDFRVQMSRTRVSPFFDMKLGSAVSNNVGTYASPSFGLRVGLGDRVGLNFTLGYTVMGTYTNNGYYTHHLNFSVGIDF